MNVIILLTVSFLNQFEDFIENYAQVYLRFTERLEKLLVSFTYHLSFFTFFSVSRKIKLEIGVWKTPMKCQRIS